MSGRWKLVVCVALALAAARPSVAEEPPTIKAGQYQGMNIVLIELAEFRRDHLGCYGYDRPTTPRVDQMAARGIRFAHVVAAAPWCVPGKNAIWTALYPSAHGVVNKFVVDGEGQVQRARLAREIPTFPELLKRQADYALVGFTGGSGVSGVSGLSRGFDVYVDDQDFAGFDRTVPLAIDWLRTKRREPFFMFLQGYTAHPQGFPPPGGYQRIFAPEYKGPLTGDRVEQRDVRERSLKLRFHPDGPQITRLDFTPADRAFYVGLYDEKIQTADAWVGQFLDALRELRLAERTILVFLAGHGDEYFDHGFLDHGPNLYEEVIHVPMIMVLPGLEEGRVIPSQVRTIDVFPTLFALVGLPHHPVIGVSVLPALNGEPMELAGFSETEYRLLTHKSAVVTADHRYKFIYTHAGGGRELYDLLEDPGEQRNLVSQRPELAAELEQALFSILGRMEQARAAAIASGNGAAQGARDVER